MKIGLVRERKNPPDKRVAFLPFQCKNLTLKHPEITFIAESSDVRCVPDEMYIGSGIHVGDEMDKCDYLFGIKEVPPASLIPGKTYFIFSHTIKKQPHNRTLLQAVLNKKITLVDYECLVDKNGHRTVAFGRFAGIVGAYNALRMWMQRFHEIRLKAAFECGDMEEMLDYARHHVPRIGNIKLAITGTGRVGQGAIEVLKAIGIKEVEPEIYLLEEFEEPVFTVLSSKHYYHKLDSEIWEEKDFRRNPEKYETKFSQFANSTDILIPCHFWDPKAPHLFSKEDTRNENFRIKVISDVTCDLNGSIPTTIRTTTIASPFLDIDPKDFQEMPAFSDDENITICAVDNLPCELPFDASMAFGTMLSECVIPELVSGNLESIEKATIAKNGILCPNFEYLSDYATLETEPSNAKLGIQLSGQSLF